MLLPALAFVPLLRGWPLRDFRREAGNGLAALLAAALLAGPWYLRNLLLAGPAGVLPAPGAFDAQFVDRSLASLLTFWGDRAEWGPWLGFAALLGAVLLCAQLLAPGKADRRKTTLLLLAFVLPYHFIWWWVRDGCRSTRGAELNFSFD